MKRELNKKEKPQKIIAELSEIKRKREKELTELDHIAKILVRRDLELSEVREKREKELTELDHIAKILVRRDLELSEVREKREKELAELKEKTQELKKSKLALLNILEDVQEARKKAEEERSKTLAVINSFSDGLLVFDKAESLSIINPQAERFLKIDSKEIIKRPILELLTVSCLKPLLVLLGIGLFGGQMIKIIHRRELVIEKNLTLEVTTIPIKRGEENIDTLVVLHDITREKIIEQLKTEFVSIAAHQLRTPLSAIKWSLKILLEGDVGKLSQEQKELIEKTYKSNERMIILINDLLDVARIEEGRFIYKLEPVDIENLISSVVDSYKREIEQKNLIVEFKKPEGKLPSFKADGEKIKLATQNLFDNAVKYSLPGGKILISLQCNKKGDREEIVFSIKDRGMGIPKDQQARVFGKFFRAVNIIKRETEGSGLGLFIVKNIIQSHGGKIWFESEENKGTTFYFSIPVKPIKEEFGEFLKKV